MNRILLVVILMMYGCGSQNGFQVSGEATVKHVVTVDLNFIDEFCTSTYDNEEEIDQCKKDLIEKFISLNIDDLSEDVDEKN